MIHSEYFQKEYKSMPAYKRACTIEFNKLYYLKEELDTLRLKGSNLYLGEPIMPQIRSLSDDSQKILHEHESITGNLIMFRFPDVRYKVIKSNKSNRYTKSGIQECFELYFCGDFIDSYAIEQQAVLNSILFDVIRINNNDKLRNAYPNYRFKK